MEVHHHPDLNHKKKNFKEYFLEFLMIFLAVTLGFFAENIRENFSNKEKEREYMENMISDLKTDTLAISSIQARWQRSNSNVDSILKLLNKDPNAAVLTSLYNLLSSDFFHFDLFKYDNKTIEELKSSGSFRLIRKKTIANQIMSYDLEMKYILIQEQDVKDYMNSSKNIESKIFDYSQLHLDPHHSLTDSSIFARRNETHHLLSNNKELIGEYFNKLLIFHVLANIHGSLFKEMKLKATDLLTEIQKEYDLKNE
jgi:hypothetical protein